MDRRALGHFHSVLEYLLLAIGWARSWPSTKCKLHDWRQGCGSGDAAEMVGWRGRTYVWCWSVGIGDQGRPPAWPSHESFGVFWAVATLGQLPATRWCRSHAYRTTERAPTGPLREPF